MEPDGLLLRDRALAEVDPDALLVALRSGRLRRLQRGIYLPRRIPETPHLLARAAVLSSGIADAVACHVTSARLRGIVVPDGRRVEHVNVSRTERRRDRRDLHFHSRSLSVGEVDRVGSVPATSVPRTLADLAADLDRLDAVWALDDAFRRGIAGREDVVAVIAGWRGGASCATARAHLGVADGISESILETAGRLVLGDRGVPLPIPQYRLRDADGRVVARLDGAYPRERIAIEWDGRDVHGRPEAVFGDRWRQNLLPELGWTILRFTWFDVMRDPDGVADRVLRSLLRRIA